MHTLKTTLRRAGATSVLAAALWAGIAPAHSQAQALPLLTSCASWTASTVSADSAAILFGAMDGSPSTSSADPTQAVLNGANYTLSYCATAARAERAVHLTGRLAHSATLRYVLAHIAAYVSDNAQVAKDSGKLYFDLNSGDATAAQADFARVTISEHAGNAELCAIAPYVGKL